MTDQSVHVEQISDADVTKDNQTITEPTVTENQPETVAMAQNGSEPEPETAAEAAAQESEEPEIAAGQTVQEVTVPAAEVAGEEAAEPVAGVTGLAAQENEEPEAAVEAAEREEEKPEEEKPEAAGKPAQEEVKEPESAGDGDQTPQNGDGGEDGDASGENDDEDGDASDEDVEDDAAVGDRDINENDTELNGKTKSELVDILASALAEKPIQTIRREVEIIKMLFYKQHRAEVEQLKNKFIEEGGAEEDFAPPQEAVEMRFKELLTEYRRRRNEYISTIEQSKENNLKIKLRIIEELKELVNSSETMNNTFNAFRELQQRWKDAGPVPQANLKDTWETYNLHVENFYSFIKINKELRDLDLKRNYEAKITLCEEAEALILETSMVNAFHKLQKLHEQWRETGPVAKEYKESLWERFREASGRINKQHQDYFEGLKEEQKTNLELKTELCVKIEEMVAAPMTSRKEWNKASDRLFEIQKVWKTIGFAPKKDNPKIYERFRAACDKFFDQKRAFYGGAKNEMDHNLKLKTELCEAAEAIPLNDDWKKNTDEIISLQRLWKEIGPVPRRHSDAIWKRFRAACDNFFEHKSHHFSNKDSEYDRNLELKQELLAQIAEADVQTGGFEMIKDFQRRWSEIGFVPIKHKDAIQKEYKAMMDTMFSALRGDERHRHMDRFKSKLSDMKNSGDRRIKSERERLYNKVKQLEADIALLENNIGFFSKSKNAEAMIRDVRDKIDRARQEMEENIEKIDLIDNQEQ